MASVFTWLDQSDQQRRKVLNLLDMFRERETVDELGLGTVRDAFADLLFPGTSAPQTRARYFLFIPWMYLEFERRRVASVDIGRRARAFERDLIEALLDAGESDGVIGRLARRNLQRLPSSIYWSGLVRLGIFTADQSQERYHGSLDSFYQGTREARTDDGDPLGRRQRNWHPRVPEAPDRFHENPALRLERDEAEFLRDQIQAAAPDSLFAALVREPSPPTDDFPWDNPKYLAYSPEVRRQLEHARNFSEVMYGAALLYNLILATLTKNSERIIEYEQKIREWAGLLRPRTSELQSWDLSDLWNCATSEGARIGEPTRRFVTEWCAEVFGGGAASVVKSDRCRQLVEARERALKRKQARVDNQRARDRWGGAAGTSRLSYRWSNAARIASDIIQGSAGVARA
jgi:hypothetical protein